MRRGAQHWPVFLAVKLHQCGAAGDHNATSGLDIVQPMTQVPIYGETITAILKDKSVLDLGCNYMLLD
jgi:hypothetical protein